MRVEQLQAEFYRRYRPPYTKRAWKFLVVRDRHRGSPKRTTHCIVVFRIDSVMAGWRPANERSVLILPVGDPALDAKVPEITKRGLSEVMEVK